MDRRHFLLLTAGSLACHALGAFAAPRSATSSGRLIVIFLRGGLDGMFAFSPTSDPRLAQLRPSLSQEVLTSGLPLAGSGFAAHPSCGALASLFQAGELAFAPCAGTSDKSRSHFQAQDVFELGSGATHGNSGFLARTAAALDAKRSISFTREIPLAFQGGTTGTPEVAPLTGSGLKLPDGRLLDALRAAHRGHVTGEALEQAMATQAEIESTAGMDVQAARGAPGSKAFAAIASHMGRMLRSNDRIALAFLDIGGLDTHANEAALLTRSLTELGDGLLALKTALGENEWRNTRVAITSEFGRTARENGTRGTDHGHGGLFLLAGGSVAGGRMLGSFDGLQDTQLNEARDLPVHADWRALLASCMQSTYDLTKRSLDDIFPGRPAQRFEV